MQDRATLHRNKEVIKILFKLFCNHMIGLGHPKFANGGME